MESYKYIWKWQKCAVCSTYYEGHYAELIPIMTSFFPQEKKLKLIILTKFIGQNLLLVILFKKKLFQWYLPYSLLINILLYYIFSDPFY